LFAFRTSGTPVAMRLRSAALAASVYIHPSLSLISEWSHSVQLFGVLTQYQFRGQQIRDSLAVMQQFIRVVVS